MKRVPIGVEDFKELISNNYYVDKSELIKDIINEKVVLYTRPRRFGKTLNMSMLYYFFSIKQKDNAHLFKGLKIEKDIEAKKHQNKYPTIFITLKDMKRNNFDDQTEKFAALISDIVDKNIELLKSPFLNERQKNLLCQYLNTTSSLSNLQDALLNISICLQKHYHNKVVILIDEYDVPLQEAYINNYYEEMIDFLKNVFSAALKTNDVLQKGVLTGCLRIAKESIFTGLNNFSTCSILDEISDNRFGFTNDEIVDILNYYHLEQYQNEFKRWYDGYLFGKTEIYNPWSTLLYVNKLIKTSSVTGELFWANTSGNEIIYRYITNNNFEFKEEFAILVKGGMIKKVIKPELTYRQMDDLNNIYSFLLFTGYLKINKYLDYNYYELMIPNHEIRMIYKETFDDWTKEIIENNSQKLIDALLNKDEDEANKILNYILLQSISYYDNKESFYHGFMIGLMNGNNTYSNIETGDGHSDIKYLPVNKEKRGFILELKLVKDKDLYDTAIEGCDQIVEKRYMESEKVRGYQDIVGYGIAFDKKRCFIKMVKD
ncbi:AAA family ATPase [Thomasclavelia cocleata]|uniref:AAA family ATPase n=1 Tax=Thomasclavelia cocleata TaxID=69824 RepID=UPI002557CB7E|nr:AAA family ATPase [Thomasclavelia cocleata]